MFYSAFRPYLKPPSQLPKAPVESMMPPHLKSKGKEPHLLKGCGSYVYNFVAQSVRLQIGKLNHLVYCGRQTVGVLAARRCVVGLTASASVDELRSLANHLPGV